jgi:hypothetical protein
MKAEEKMAKQVEPKAIVGQLVNWDPSGALITWLLFDTVSGNTFKVPSVDAVEWITRGRGQYQKVLP